MRKLVDHRPTPESGVRKNIAGNSYRLIVSLNYKYRAGYIKFFGTHAAYDNVDASTVDHTGVQHGKARR